MIPTTMFFPDKTDLLQDIQEYHRVYGPVKEVKTAIGIQDTVFATAQLQSTCSPCYINLVKHYTYKSQHPQ